MQIYPAKLNRTFIPGSAEQLLKKGRQFPCELEI